MYSDLLTTQEAAKLLRLSPRTLERYRKDGVGPFYIREEWRIFYRPDDIDDWQQDNRQF